MCVTANMYKCLAMLIKCGSDNSDDGRICMGTKGYLLLESVGGGGGFFPWW